MTDEDEIKKFRKFMETHEECTCLDGSFEDFDKCCGKKHGIINPVVTLFKIVAEMSAKSTVPRLKDMNPDQAKKNLNKLFTS